MPRVAKSKRGELPKPVVKAGSLGFAPLNDITLSYLYQGHGDAVLGFRDAEPTVMLKTRPNVSVMAQGKRDTLDLSGKIYNGFTDALYRGKLSQVICCHPAPGEEMMLLNDVVDYLHKVLSLGLFIPKRVLAKGDPVEDHIPCWILTGNGLMFSRFMTGLVHHMKALIKEHPELDERTVSRIMGRFVRAVAVTEDPLYPTGNDSPWQMVGKLPNRIKIAGGSQQSRDIIQSTLSLHRLVTIVENRAPNAPERLEFEYVLQRLTAVIFPLLFQQGALPTDELSQWTNQATRGIYRIGCHRKAFDESEPMEPMPTKKGMTPPRGHLHPGDKVMVEDLCEYADALGLTEEKQLFGRAREILHGLMP